mgnify:CR=1 FL=1
MNSYKADWSFPRMRVAIISMKSILAVSVLPDMVGLLILGVSYKLLDKLTLSASVLDLGFIKWSKSNTSIARANAEQTYDLLEPGLAAGVHEYCEQRRDS